MILFIPEINNETIHSSIYINYVTLHFARNIQRTCEKIYSTHKTMIFNIYEVFMFYLRLNKHNRQLKCDS